MAVMLYSLGIVVGALLAWWSLRHTSKVDPNEMAEARGRAARAEHELQDARVRLETSKAAYETRLIQMRTEIQTARMAHSQDVRRIAELEAKLHIAAIEEARPVPDPDPEPRTTPAPPARDLPEAGDDWWEDDQV